MFDVVTIGQVKISTVMMGYKGGEDMSKYMSQDTSRKGRQTCHPNGASNHSPIAHIPMDEDKKHLIWGGSLLVSKNVIFGYQPTLLTQPHLMSTVVVEYRPTVALVPVRFCLGMYATRAT